MRRLFFAAAVLALASGGCATGHAKTAPVPTALDVPAPPPRVIAPPEPEAPPTEVRGINTDPVPRKPPPRTSAAQLDAKPDPPPPPDLPVVTAPPAVTLKQEVPATSGDVLKKKVGEDLTKARVDLGRVNRAVLNADAKSQYDTAQRFVVEAQQALNEGNLVFAAKVAEKAAGLAAGLRVR